MCRLLRPAQGESLLDAGCGTGYFTRRFAEASLTVAGLDPDPAMLAYARKQGPRIPWIRGDVENLPCGDRSFDLVTAVTSLCFVDRPEKALREMWRVARRGVLVGLLNRHSLLYARKAGRGGYAGARWDTLARAESWARDLAPPPAERRWGTAVFLPGGGSPARILEPLLPAHLPLGAFLAVLWEKPGNGQGAGGPPQEEPGDGA